MIKSLDQLAREGILTAAVVAMPEFVYGGTVANLPKRAANPMPPDSSEFSRLEALRGEPTRISFAFSPSPLQVGIYRIDLLWDGRPTWRTFIRISE